LLEGPTVFISIYIF